MTFPNRTARNRNGPTAADLRTFGSNGFQATPSAPVEVKGGPGLKSNLQTDLESIIGQPRAVPLFSSFRGNGNNTHYTIIGFAGVTIVRASSRGNHMEIVFQPMVVIDPTATSSTSATRWWAKRPTGAARGTASHSTARRCTPWSSRSRIRARASP